MPCIKLDWFSIKKCKGKYANPQHALREHIQYIANPKRNDVIYVHNLDLTHWIENAEKEIAKRYDARIAGKLLLALPNSLLNNPKEIENFIQTIMSKIRTKEYGFSIHYSVNEITQEKNLHAHIVFSPRTTENKKIRINAKDMQELHKTYKNLFYSYTPPQPNTPLKPPKLPPAIQPYHFHLYRQGKIKSPWIKEGLDLYFNYFNFLNTLKKFINEIKIPTPQTKPTIQTILQKPIPKTTQGPSPSPQGSPKAPPKERSSKPSYSLKPFQTPRKPLLKGPRPHKGHSPPHIPKPEPWDNGPSL